MSAFLLVEIVGVKDEAGYAEYRNNVSPTLEAVGGEYLVRGGNPERLCGDWRPNRLVMVRFSEVGSAVGWWASPGYADLRAARQNSTDSRMLVAAGTSAAGRTETDEDVFVLLDIRQFQGLDRRDDHILPLRGSAAARGGSCMVADNQLKQLEGNWGIDTLAVFAFPSADAARSWWSDPVPTQAIRGLRSQGSVCAVLAHGLNEGVKQ